MVSKLRTAIGMAPSGVTRSTVSSVVGATNTYTTGVIDGNAAFVVSELPISKLDEFELDITWSCGTGHEATTNPQGYQFRLSDIGCAGYSQKMTLRYATNPNRVSLEQYGNTAVSRTEPTTTVTGGQAFAFDRGALSIGGVLQSHNAQQAVVDIDYIRWDGVDLCTAGVYTFAAE